MAPQASLAKIGKEGFDIIDKFFGKQSHRQISHPHYLPQDSYTHYAPPEAYTARATKYYMAQEADQPARATNKAYYSVPHEAQPARATNKAYYSVPHEAQPARATKAYYLAPHEAQPARVTKAYYAPPEATTASSYHYYEKTTQSAEYQKPIFQAAFN